MQTTRAIASLIFRVVLLGIAVPVLLSDFPGHMLPSRIMTDWATITALDALSVVAPLARWRKMALLAGILVAGAHYYFRHHVPVLDVGYVLLAIGLVLLPASGRATGDGRRSGFAPSSRNVRGIR
jgi:hypothetical protein